MAVERAREPAVARFDTWPGFDRRESADTAKDYGGKLPGTALADAEYVIRNRAGFMTPFVISGHRPIYRPGTRHKAVARLLDGEPLKTPSARQMRLG